MKKDMQLLRRFTISLGVAVSMLATITIASVGAAGGFGSGAGRFTFTDVSASASYLNPSDGSSTNLSVVRTLFMFRPRTGGPLQGPQLMTVLSASYFVPNPVDPTLPPLVDDSVTAVIPDADFTVSDGVHTATLNTNVNVGTCEELVPVNGALPAKGGGGCGTGFKFPMTITATWTGTGTVGHGTDSGAFHCGTFVATKQDRSDSEFSANITATLGDTVAFSGGRPFVFGFVGSDQQVMMVSGSGILSAACGGKG